MPQIKIVLPSEGQTILGDKITVSFIAGDFNVGADGYLNLWLDNPVEEVSTAAKITGQFDYTLSSVPAGPHRLTLEAIGSNHLSFHPPVKQTVFFSTMLPQVPSTNPTSVPFTASSLVSFINWQYVLLIAAVAIIIAGLLVKSLWGKPKTWE